MHRIRMLVPALLTATLALNAAYPAMGKNAPSVTFSVSPKKVRVGARLTVKASHLAAKRYYILLYSPDRKPKRRAFLPPVRSNSRGVISKRVSLPAVDYCGPATLDLYTPKTRLAAAHIRVYGCKAGKTTSPPPPPKGH